MENRPTYFGFVETVDDAATLANACLQGHLNPITQRYKYEDRPVQEGDCFVFIDKKSSVKRWTDGKQWSPSRYLGNFLVYRELETLTGNRRNMSKVKEDGLIKKTVSVEIRGWRCHIICYYTLDHGCNTPSRDPNLPLLLESYSIITNATTPGTRVSSCKRSTGAKRKRSDSEMTLNPNSCDDHCPQLPRFPEDYFAFDQ